MSYYVITLEYYIRYKAAQAILPAFRISEDVTMYTFLQSFF